MCIRDRCDYGQKPDEALKDPHQQRVKGFPWKWVFSGFFMAGGIRLVVEDWTFAAAAVVDVYKRQGHRGSSGR